MTTPRDPGSPNSPPRVRARLAALLRGTGARSASAARGRADAAVRPAVGVLRGAAIDAQKSRLPQMAAALSYRTIFGIIPVIVVGLVGLRAFATDEDITHLLTKAMEFAGISRIVVEERESGAAEVQGGGSWFGPVQPEAKPVDPPPPAQTGGDAAPADPVVAIAKPAPSEGAEAEAEPPTTGSVRLDQWISNLVNGVRSIPFKTIGLIGLVALLYGAISMLVEVERAFNQIYRVPVGRSWVRRVTQYWTLLTLGTLFLFLTFYVGERSKVLLVDFAAKNNWSTGNTLFAAAIGFATTVCISTALLLLMYTTVPNTKVRLHPALAGAFVGALLWESGKWGFTQYITYSAGYSKLYGSIALIPLFLLWVYGTWLVVLFGLQISYYLQYGRDKKVPVPGQQNEPAVVDPGSILVVVAALAERFEAGQASSQGELADALGLHPPVLAQMLARLVEGGFIHQVAGREDGDERYVLSRPPSRITAEEVLAIGEELSGRASGPGAPSGLAETLRRARSDSVRGSTIADLVRAADTQAGPSRPRNPPGSDLPGPSAAAPAAVGQG